MPDLLLADEPMTSRPDGSESVPSPTHGSPSRTLSRRTRRGLDDPGLLLLALFAAVGVTLRLLRGVTRTTLSLDEFQIAGSLRDYTSVELLTRRLMYDQSAPPGFLIPSRGMFLLFGGDDHALRVLPLVGGLLVVVLAVLVARQQLRTSAARTLLVAALSLSPILIAYSSIVKQYSTDALAGILLLHAWGARDRPGGMLRLTAVGAVCAIASLPAVFLLSAITLVLVLSHVEWTTDTIVPSFVAAVRRHLRLALTWGAVLIVHAVHAYRATDRQDMVDYWTRHGGLPPADDGPLATLALLWRATTEMAWLGLASGQGWTTWIAPQAVSGAIAVALLASSVGLILRSRRTDAAVPLTALALGLIAGALGLYPATGRLLVWSVPLVAYVFALAVDTRGSDVRPAGRRLSTIVMLAAYASIASSLLTTSAAVQTWDAPATTPRAAFALVAAEALPGDVLVVDRWTRFAYFWHGPDVIPDELPVEILRLVDVRPDDVARLTELARHGRVWIVSTHRASEAADTLEPLLLRWQEGFRLEEPEVLIVRLDP